jgi:hypothetical protein
MVAGLQLQLTVRYKDAGVDASVAFLKWRIRDSHLLRSDVKARHDKMAGLVERMLKLHKDLPKAKPPHVPADGLRPANHGDTIGDS